MLAMLSGRPSHLRSRINLLKVRKVGAVTKDGMVGDNVGYASMYGERLAVARVRERTALYRLHHDAFFRPTPVVSGAGNLKLSHLGVPFLAARVMYVKSTDGHVENPEGCGSPRSSARGREAIGARTPSQVG
jgi:hypothetical protein